MDAALLAEALKILIAVGPEAYALIHQAHAGTITPEDAAKAIADHSAKLAATRAAEDAELAATAKP